MIFEKDAKTTQWEKDGLQQVVLGKLDVYMQRNKDVF